MAADEANEPWLDPSVWDVVRDDSIPPGVIEFRHPDGRRDRFPLIEFMVDEPPHVP